VAWHFNPPEIPWRAGDFSFSFLFGHPAFEPSRYVNSVSFAQRFFVDFFFFFWDEPSSLRRILDFREY